MENLPILILFIIYKSNNSVKILKCGKYFKTAYTSSFKKIPSKEVNEFILVDSIIMTNDGAMIQEKKLIKYVFLFYTLLPLLTFLGVELPK